MQLNAVKPRQAGVASRLGVFLDKGFDFMRFKGAWHVIGLHANAVRDHFARRQQGAGRHCFCACCLDVMAAYAAAMHDLQHDQTAFGMNRIGHLQPALDLFGCGNAGLSAIGLACGAGPSAFGHNQSCVAALAIIISHQVVGNTVCIGAVACHGGHDDAIF